MLLMLAGCRGRTAPADHVAELGGEPVLYASFEEFLRTNAIEDPGVLGSDILSSLLDQFLDERLLSRLARDELGLTELDDGRQAASVLLLSLSVAVEPAEVVDFYQRNRTRFDLPERVHLRQLLFTSRESAEKARALWIGGASWDAVVESLAEDPAAYVGEEGEFSREDLPPALADALFALEPGAISEVLTAAYGFHLFQVVARLPGGLQRLPEVESEIRAELIHARERQELERLVAKARERYNVQVFGRNVPFNYDGRNEHHIDDPIR